MQSFCQETEFALTDDVHHNKLKKHHSNHHHNRHNNHVAGGGGGGGGGGSSSGGGSSGPGSGVSGPTTTAQGGPGGGGGGPSSSSSSNVTATHMQQQQEQLAQLLNSNSNYYGHTFSGASPTIPATSSPSSFASTSSPMTAKVISKGGGAGGGTDSDRAMISAEKRSSLAAKTPGRAKFNSIDNESLKESGGGGAGGSSRKSSSGSGLGVSPSKKLKKSSSSGGGGGGASSSSSKHHHHSSSSNHHHHSRTSSSNSSSGQKPTASGGTGADAAQQSQATMSAAAVQNYERGVNVGYNLFAKLRDLYNELKAETSPRKQSMNLLSTSFLLDKLVARENLNTLVLNLYPGNKGYSLAFRVVTGSSSGSTTGLGTGNSGGHLDASSSGGSSGGRRDRLQSSGAVPNTINSSSPSHHHHPHHHPHHSNTHGNSPSSQSHPMTPSAGGASSTSSSSLSAGGGGAGDLHETMRWPYEEEELLACIDNEELPLMFVDLFEKRCPQLFYSGCVIVEVRDYRQSFPISTACDKFHVLLRPTNQTLLADVQALTSEGEWSHEEKMALESQLILATAEPLCLNPSPQVGINSINGQHERRMFNSMPIRRHAKKFSQVAINRKRKTDQFTHHFGLELFDFMARHRQRPRLSLGSCTTAGMGPSSSSGGNAAAAPTTPTTSLNSFAAAAAARLKRAEVQPVRAPSLSLPETLQPPSGEVNVERFAKAFERPRETKDCMPQLVEEYVLETDRGNGRVNFIKLSILQRPSNSEYLGMLYLDRDYREDQRNGEACQFSLGTRAHANRYIQQFTEIFTEEGRKKVKITHMIPGQQPRVTCTTGLWEQQQQQQGPQGAVGGVGGVAQPQSQPERPQPPQMQLPAVQQIVTPTGGGGVTGVTRVPTPSGIITVGGVQGMEQQSTTVAATLGPQGQLVLGKAPQFSFQVHHQQPQQQQPGQVVAGVGQATVVGGNLGISGNSNKLVQVQQQGQGIVPQNPKPATPNLIQQQQHQTVTLTSPVQMQQQQQLQQGVGQTAQLLANSQIKLVSTNLGANHQFIQFATTTVPQQQHQTIDGQGIIGSTAGGQQQQLHVGIHGGQQGQQQPIQYAAIMNCDNTLLKNAISSGSQLGIRNGSLVLLQQNQAGKTSAVSLVQTSGGQITTAGGGGGNIQTTQMHVTLPQGLTQAGGGAGRQLQLQTGGVPVLQAQLVGVPITQQPQQSPVQTQQQQQQQLLTQATTAAVVMSPPPPQQQVIQTGGSSVGGAAGGGVVPQQQQHQQQHMVQQAQQGQFTSKQHNIHSSNPAINALFTSILASANQFEQQQAAAAAAAAAAASNNNSSAPSTPVNPGPSQSPLPMAAVAGTPIGKVLTATTAAAATGGAPNTSSSSNSTIINLLNSAPAAMTNKLGGGGGGGGGNTTTATVVNPPTTPIGPPQLVNAFSGLVSPPPSSTASSSSQYGNSPATPITGTTNLASSIAAGGAMNEMEQHHVQLQQQLSKPLTKQQMSRLLNGGTESPGLSSPSPSSEGSGTEQQQQQHHHQTSVRVTMSALASQLASPPAIMTNSIIQQTKHMVAQQQQQQQQQSVKVNLSGPGGPMSVAGGVAGGGGGAPGLVYGLNGLHQGATIMQQQQQQMQQQQRLNNSTPTPPPPIAVQGMVTTSASGGGSTRREILANIMSPGSDSNHSTASSFSLSMPTLNNLLSGGGGGGGQTLTREVIGGPGSVGATSSNGGNSMPPSPSPAQLVTTNKVTTAGGNILTIHASPGGGGQGGLISNNTLVQQGSSSSSNSGGVNNNNSMLIERLTAMANNNSSSNSAVGVTSHSALVGNHVVNTQNSNVPTSILQLQAQSPQQFLANAMVTGGQGAPQNKQGSIISSSSSSHNNPSQQQQQQQFTIPIASSPKANAGGVGGATVMQNIQLQASPVGSGNVSPQAHTTTTGTTTTLNLQGLNLASLQGAMATIPGLQNVQVQIPGLPHTFSLSLSNNPGGGQGGGGGGGQVGTTTVGGVGQQIQTTAGGQQTVVLTNPGGGQAMPFAQLVNAAGLKGLTQQGQTKHLVATSVAGSVSGGQGTPIQLVGLQMNPGSRNITATVSAASVNQSQTTTIISSAGPKLPVHRLTACPQLVRTLSSSGSGTTLKLTQTGGLQVQSGGAATQGIFVNQSSGVSPSFLMTPAQLQALQKQKQQQHQQAQQQQQQQQMQAGNVQVPTTTIVAKATTKHGK